MNGHGSSPSSLLTTFVIVLAIADAFAVELGGCQKQQTQSATSPTEQTAKTPAPSDKNPGDSTGNMQPQTDQSGGTGQKSQ